MLLYPCLLNAWHFLWSLHWIDWWDSLAGWWVDQCCYCLSRILGIRCIVCPMSFLRLIVITTLLSIIQLIIRISRVCIVNSRWWSIGRPLIWLTLKGSMWVRGMIRSSSRGGSSMGTKWWPEWSALAWMGVKSIILSINVEMKLIANVNNVT